MSDRERDRLFLWVLLVIVAVTLAAAHQHRVDVAYSAGLQAGIASRKSAVRDAYNEGYDAGAQETAEGAYEAGKCQGWLDALALWEQGGAEAMKVQLAVVKGER